MKVVEKNSVEYGYPRSTAFLRQGTGSTAFLRQGTWSAAFLGGHRCYDLSTVKKAIVYVSDYCQIKMF